MLSNGQNEIGQTHLLLFITILNVSCMKKHCLSLRLIQPIMNIEIPGSMTARTTNSAAEPIQILVLSVPGPKLI
jgi:hypothetical protein